MPLPDDIKPSIPEKIAEVPQKVAAVLDKSPRVVNDWRNGFRWLSNQAFIAIGAAQSTWMLLDADQRAAFPKNFIFWFSGTIAAVGFFLRFLQQRRPPENIGDWPPRPPC